MRISLNATNAVLGVVLAAGAAIAQPGRPGPGGEPLDWRTLEAPIFSNHRQITSRDDFLKAGEAYYSPDGREIVFQAIRADDPNANPDHYAMFWASPTGRRDEANRIALLSRDDRRPATYRESSHFAREISPPGSANTCAWFHPTDRDHVLFASTLVPPSTGETPGYQRGTSRYRWAFPSEMKIVTTGGYYPLRSTDAPQDLNLAGGPGHAYFDNGARFAWMHSDTGRAVAGIAEVIINRPGYTAECSYSPDGRHILYAQIDADRSNAIGRNDADLWIFDTETGSHTRIVEAPGYDGGPFFSPDGRHITYRSDRSGNNLLQVFVTELVFDESGAITGSTNETQVTDGKDVNWAPFWHPSGRFLIYASSRVGHWNYEVFALPVFTDDGEIITGAEPVRLTFADGFDGLPVFSPDGSQMMWTAQRGPLAEGEGRPSSQLWVADVDQVALVRKVFEGVD